MLVAQELLIPATEVVRTEVYTIAYAKQNNFKVDKIREVTIS
jgi:hypothetical protein